MVQWLTYVQRVELVRLKFVPDSHIKSDPRNNNSAKDRTCAAPIVAQLASLLKRESL